MCGWRCRVVALVGEPAIAGSVRSAGLVDLQTRSSVAVPLKRKLGVNRGPRAVGALNGERAAQRLDTVTQPDEPGAAHRDAGRTTSAKNLNRVLTQVQNDGGGMPSFTGTLSQQQIADVAAFVVRSITNRK